MKKFEYKTFITLPKHDLRAGVLKLNIIYNELGKEGWEVITPIKFDDFQEEDDNVVLKCLFKREIVS